MRKYGNCIFANCAKRFLPLSCVWGLSSCLGLEESLSYCHCRPLGLLSHLQHSSSEMPPRNCRLLLISLSLSHWALQYCNPHLVVSDISFHGHWRSDPARRLVYCSQSVITTDLVAKVGPVPFRIFVVVDLMLPRDSQLFESSGLEPTRTDHTGVVHFLGWASSTTRAEVPELDPFCTGA